MDGIINLDLLKVKTKGNKEGNGLGQKKEKKEILSQFSNEYSLNDNKEKADTNFHKEVMESKLLISKKKKMKKPTSNDDNKNIDIGVISPHILDQDKNIKLGNGIIKDNIISNSTGQKSNTILKKNTKIDKTTFNISHENKLSENHNQFQSLHNKKNNLGIKNGVAKIPTNDTNNIFSRVQENNKKRINTFFKNYVNYKNRKSIKSNLKMVKLALMTKIKTLGKINLNEHKINLLKNDNIVRKESSIFNQVPENVKKILPDSNNKDDYTITDRSNSLDGNNRSVKVIDSLHLNNGLDFDRLKNILDIKSNDVNERLINIFEKNLKTGNNSFEIQLMPENLGKIQITVEMLNDNNVDINIRAESSNSIQLINENNNNLQKMLQNNGLNLSNFNLNNNQNKNFSNNHGKTTKKAEDAESIKESNKIQSDIHGKKNNLVYIKA